ncbi:hypothetical protein F4677DRAFT_380686 [Hypoxylon crocopeplum]|nr:hypothetical protein F4677DRAFT_380686 [Hypoxylon crocopeplum]
MSITFGSVGDIIAVSILVKDFILALDDVRGSASEYQSLKRQLNFLDRALLSVERLRCTTDATPDLISLYATADEIATKCRESIQKFQDRNLKYDRSLSGKGSGNCLIDTARKIQWKACRKDDEVTKLCNEVANYTSSLNVLLATAGITTLDLNAKRSKEAISAASKKADDCLARCNKGIQKVHKRTKKNTKLISQGNGLVRRLADRFEWMSRFGCDIKRLLSGVVAGNNAIYAEILCLRNCVATFTSRVPRSISEEPFLFEDACGHVAPIHLTYITTWHAFQAVLESRFQDRPGLENIQRKEYSLQEEATGREIARSGDIRQDVLPGQKIVQDILFREDEKTTGNSSSDTCPYCNHIERNSEGSVQCSKCKKYFRRKKELAEKKDFDLSHFSNSSQELALKASAFPKSGRDDAERSTKTGLDLYCYFKRICIIIQPKAAAEDDHLIVTSSNPKLLSCNDIWNKLQQFPKVASGDIDFDSLCSALQKKAKCGGSGAVVDEVDFSSVMRKFLGTPS